MKQKKESGPNSPCPRLAYELQYQGHVELGWGHCVRRNISLVVGFASVFLASTGVPALAQPSECQGMQCQPPQTCCGFLPYLGAEIGGGWQNHQFATNPTFNVPGSGVIGGFNGGFWLPINNSPLAIGARAGWVGGNLSGTTSNQAASPGNSYTVATRSIGYVEGGVGWGFGKAFDSFWSPDWRTSIYGAYEAMKYNSQAMALLGVSAGSALVNTSVACSCGARSSNTTVGFTAAASLLMPLLPQVALQAQVRYINLPSTNFIIPGTVPIKGNIYLATIGLTWFPTVIEPEPAPARRMLRD